MGVRSKLVFLRQTELKKRKEILKTEVNSIDASNLKTEDNKFCGKFTAFANHSAVHSTIPISCLISLDRQASLPQWTDRHFRQGPDTPIRSL